MHNPFLSTPTQSAGHGSVYLALLPPAIPVLQTMTYQYPLKLISPAPTTLVQYHNNDIDNASATSSQAREHLIHTLYILTYGGGIVAGDSISLDITLDPTTRLILLTQGSTKIFKSPHRNLLSTQRTRITLHPDSAVCYLPDPVQPFERSSFHQAQHYDILPPQHAAQGRASLCALDWLTCGRAANGEHWDFWKYASKNQVYLLSAPNTDGSAQKRTLLLRDNLVLDVLPEEDDVGSIAARMDSMGVFGTLIIYGPLFEDLGRYFMHEFKVLPRIGGRKWDTGSDDEAVPDEHDIKRAIRQRQERADGVLWSAAAVRGCVVVKFGAREVQGGRRWVRSMLECQGTVMHHFGERAFMCLR